MGLGWPSPDPRLRMAVEVVRSNTDHVGTIAVIGQGLSSEGFASEDPPPAFDEIQPRRSHRNERMPNAWMGLELLADRSTGMAR